MKHLLKDPALWREAAYIGGEWLAETPHGRYALHNPADGKRLVELPRCREDETRRAIDAAQAAFGPWRRTTTADRSRGQLPRRGMGRHHVYRRRLRPCFVCGTAIASRPQGAALRMTFYCPRCQHVR